MFVFSAKLPKNTGMFKLFLRIHSSFMLVFFALGVLLGTVFCFLFNLRPLSSPIWIITSAVLLIFPIIFPIRVFVPLALLSGFMLSSFRVYSELRSLEDISKFYSHEVVVFGEIPEDPDFDGASYSINLKATSINNLKDLNASFFVKLRTTEKLSRYDRLTLRGKLGDKFGSFSATMFLPKLLEISSPDPPDPILSLRDNFSENLKKHITAPESSLSLGYLLGQKTALDKELSEALRTVGLTHIVVASGANLLILVGLSRRIFSKISRFASLFFGVVLILLFTVMVGFSPSILRAGVVSILSLLAWFVGRKFHPIKLLLLVAALTLLINPGYILSLAWLLSFASFSGIMILSPILTSYLYGDRQPNFIVQVFLETFCAQLFCLPFILFFFGSVSLVGIIANAIILPTIPLVMLLSFLAGLTYFLPVFPALVGFFATQILHLHILIANYFSQLTWAIIGIPSENPLVFCIFIPLVVLCIASGYRLNRQNVLE